MPTPISVTPPDPFAATGNQALDGLLDYISALSPTDPQAVGKIIQAAKFAKEARAGAVVKVEDKTPTP